MLFIGQHVNWEGLLVVQALVLDVEHELHQDGNGLPAALVQPVNVDLLFAFEAEFVQLVFVLRYLHYVDICVVNSADGLAVLEALFYG